MITLKDGRTFKDACFTHVGVALTNPNEKPLVLTAVEFQNKWSGGVINPKQVNCITPVLDYDYEDYYED